MSSIFQSLFRNKYNNKRQSQYMRCRLSILCNKRSFSEIKVVYRKIMIIIKIRDLQIKKYIKRRELK